MAEEESPSVMPKVITFLSSMLEKVAESNDHNQKLQQQHKISVFHGLTRPNISIQNYLERIFKYANCSPSCFIIVAYVYLDRFTQRQPSLPINSFNVHRLLITSVMVAAKFMDDMSVSLSLIDRISLLKTFFTSTKPTFLHDHMNGGRITLS
ncbi:cyclin-U4-1-like [Vigna umbellata]|uniref:cyclin-U4-1-like n=1 Tax=Vigna umbellata TaxID=87088 RepID=UPI001F5E8CB8|nr:cyclin-U4-1-like [Vigna umbellata]